MRRTLALAAIGALAAGPLTGAVLAQELDAERLTEPDDVAFYEAPQEELAARGEELFNDESLGNSGMACQSCHADFQAYNDTFMEPYPHPVAMASSMAGMEEVTAAEMVQLCMVVPMSAEPLAWDSEELAALTAYVKAERERFAAR